MAIQAIIAERPAPPKGRLSFPALLARMTRNPVASWGEDFYEQPIVPYRFLGRDIAFVMDPELIQTILRDEIDDFTKSPIYTEVLGSGGGEGLLIAEGEKWRWQRRLAAPIFRAEEIESYLPTFVADSEDLLARWAASAHGVVQPVGQDATELTLQSLLSTLLGADLGVEDRQLVTAEGTAFLEPTGWKIAYASLRLPPWLPHPGRRRMERAALALRAVARGAMAKRRASGNPGTDLLGRLMTAEEPGTLRLMPDELIVDNLVTYFLAGHETTAKALSWTLYLLALLPAWQERVRAEIATVANGAAIDSDGLRKLELLECVFQESMRLYPPAPSLMRRVRKSTRLGNIELREGATIVIPIYVVHRHRRLWRDPLAFDPLRFDEAECAARHRYAYIPFGAGPRSCIAGSFAMLEAKSMLATLLAGARFQLPPDEAPTPVARVTLRSSPSISLKVTLLRD
jgi:cytochrome P450